jgi:hypothetical protein
MRIWPAIARSAAAAAVLSACGHSAAAGQGAGATRTPPRTTASNAAITRPGPCAWPVAPSVTTFEGERAPHLGANAPLAIANARSAFERWSARKVSSYRLVVRCGFEGGFDSPGRLPLNTYEVTVRDGRAVDGLASEPTVKRPMSAGEASLFTVEELFAVARTILAQCVVQADCTVYANVPGLFATRRNGGFLILGLNGAASFPESFGFQTVEGPDVPWKALHVTEFHALGQ